MSVVKEEGQGKTQNAPGGLSFLAEPKISCPGSGHYLHQTMHGYILDISCSVYIIYLEFGEEYNPMIPAIVEWHSISDFKRWNCSVNPDSKVSQMMLAGAEHKDQAVSKKIVSDGESSFFIFFFFFFGLEENCFGCRLSIAAGDKQQRSACDLSALPSARLLAKYRNDTSSMFGSDDIITPSTFLRSNMAASIKRASGNDLRQPICRSCLADLRSANSNRGLESTHRISGNSTA
ncbi:hypothetical protein CAPTEDRAFT_199783 [Capitella teleta]|uniref:Uncharacterized protein n=1 Tax=Capitella teleta TaxID=283909 RepID=R7V796_CAPTE|nr:hypothetical protein CAPTEDRAFT_199783 [Capitella teleta]|eukprot:ELU12241.1 hypothetical protein CAPTEDRAFT_199783 [Capitella teleta]